MSDRPAPTEDEIEVTPEMIEAGVAALAAHSPRFYTTDEIAASVYRAMSRENRGLVFRKTSFE